MNFKNGCVVILIFLMSCSHDFQGPYEKLMEPVIKVKLANPNMTFDGEVEPPMPDPDENKKTVMGVDVNKNGVRDDIEIYINRTYADSNVRMALKQYVRAEVGFINSVKFQDKKITMGELERHDRVLACLQFILPFDQSNMTENLSKVFYNVKIRDDAYGRSQHILGPKSSSGISTSEYLNYDKYCEFKINDYDKVRENFLKVWNQK